MITHLIVLDDGTEISSGLETVNALINVSVTETVNDDFDISIGSVCASVFKANLITPGASINIAAGSKFTAYRVIDGERVKIGVYNAEKPTRPSANRYKITAYDNVIKLDKDLTDWINNLSGWPYSIGALAKMVCSECGVNLVTEDFPNSEFMSNRPVVSDRITGRQILRWIAEIAGKFCVANPDGDLEFQWYKEIDSSITPSIVSYSDFTTDIIDSVKIRLADIDSGALWPEGETENPYVIKGNRFLNSNIVDGTRAFLDVIFSELRTVTFTPCKATISADLQIHAGDIVRITDINGIEITAYVMKVTYSGQMATIEATGNKKRNSGELTNFLSNKDIKDYAQESAQSAVDAQSQQAIFDKLTGGGAESGIYLKDGVLFINANFIQAGYLSSDIIRAGRIRSTDFSIGLIEKIYPLDSLYPSGSLLPNNGEQIVRGFEIDFEAGVIRGAFWSESVSRLEQENKQLSNDMANMRNRLSALEAGLIYPRSVPQNKEVP